MDAAGKVVLVTGAARRVGRAIALELARAGSDVAIHYRTSADDASELAGLIAQLGRRTALVPGDLADPQTPARLVAETTGALGRLDVLVNNASVYTRTALEPDAAQDWQTLFHVNVIAPAMLSAAAVPHMRQAGAGRIINLTDVLADRPVRSYDAYCASKAALASLTRSLAIELAPEITVNAVAPGIALFPDDYDQAKRERLISRVPLGRAVTPEDVAATVRFLVTTADYVTGQTITVDGGWSVPR